MVSTGKYTPIQKDWAAPNVIPDPIMNPPHGLGPSLAEKYYGRSTSVPKKPMSLLKLILRRLFKKVRN